MDYCHVCRRHLNGALACPGCGTPVDELGADVEETGAGPRAGAGADARHAEDADVEWRSRRAARRRGAGVPEAGDGQEDPRDREVPAGVSRRDRKAAAHRRKRRRTLFIAVGFVLAAGGLSLAELGVDAPGLGPSPAAAESPGGAASPTVSALPKSSASGSPSAGRTSGSSPSPSASPSVSRSASPTATGEKGAGGGSASAGALPGRSTSAPSAAPSAPRTTAPATTSPETSAPAPAPSSSGCNKFLWWCT
ncbi:SCO2400 family protein [Streptomyces sp. NPDC002516]